MVLASAWNNNWIPYDNSVTNRDRANIYLDCAFGTSYMAQRYQETYWNNFDAFLDLVVGWLKDNAIYVLLTPYVDDSESLANLEGLWAWIGAAISNHGCCSMSMIYYVIDTVVTTVWSRIDFDQFRNLLWHNLNQYTTVEQYYWDNFWTTCPFTYWELYKNIIEPLLRN